MAKPLTYAERERRIKIAVDVIQNEKSLTPYRQAARLRELLGVSRSSAGKLLARARERLKTDLDISAGTAAAEIFNVLREIMGVMLNRDPETNVPQLGPAQARAVAKVAETMVKMLPDPETIALDSGPTQVVFEIVDPRRSDHSEQEGQEEP